MATHELSDWDVCVYAGRAYTFNGDEVELLPLLVDNDDNNGGSTMMNRMDEIVPTLLEGDAVRVMLDSGEVIDGTISIATNALWADVEVVAVVKRDNDNMEV